jgi:CheY-like chemotaxis protein
MGQKVLVFESDVVFATELRNELHKLGCIVTVVDDGNAGLAQASAEPPDLILLSIELPRMNGFSVCNKLKKDPALKDVPLVILSSESSDETFEQHRKLRTRAEDYVHKPIAFPDLLARIAPFAPIGEVAAHAAHASVDDGPGIVTEVHQGDLAATQAVAVGPSEADEDILIEEMPSRPPRSDLPPALSPGGLGGNGHQSIDAALDAALSEDFPAPARRSERPSRASAAPTSHTTGQALAALEPIAMAMQAGFDPARELELEREAEAARDRIRDLEGALARAQNDASRAKDEAARARRRRGSARRKRARTPRRLRRTPVRAPAVRRMRRPRKSSGASAARSRTSRRARRQGPSRAPRPAASPAASSSTCARHSTRRTRRSSR